MKAKSIHRKIERTPEEMARIKRIREFFQSERPSLDELVASGECGGPIPQYAYFDMLHALLSLKREREKLGLSLSDVARRSGMNESFVRRLESGKNTGAPFDTIYRYMAALGKRISWRFEEFKESKSPKSSSRQKKHASV